MGTGSASLARSLPPSGVLPPEEPPETRVGEELGRRINSESLALEVGPSSVIRLLAKPGWMTDSHATRIDRAEGRGRSFGREDHRNHCGNSFQSSAKNLFAGGTENIAAACVCIHDRLRFHRRQQLDRGVNRRKLRN